MPWPVVHPEHPYSIHSDVTGFDFNRIHHWLSGDAYWSKGIPFDVCVKSFENSLSYGLFHETGNQVGCARMITDQATFAYLADVYIVDDHRGLSLGYWLVETIMADERLSGLRRFMLATSNMHTLYEKFGFHALEKPEIIMERTSQNIYQ
jgi:GNAT superfamily N-acetyltransferase